MSNNIFFSSLIGGIDERNVAKTVADIDIANSKRDIAEVVLTLASYGGDLLLGIALFDHIKASKKPVKIIAEGVCMSVAVTILQAAKKRVSRPHTLFMVHPSISSLEERSYPEFISIVDQYKKNHDLFVQLTIERSGMTKEDFERIYNPRKYLTPAQAMDFGSNGLIDEIEELHSQ